MATSLYKSLTYLPEIDRTMRFCIGSNDSDVIAVGIVRRTSADKNHENRSIADMFGNV